MRTPLGGKKLYEYDPSEYWADLFASWALDCYATRGSGVERAPSWRAVIEPWMEEYATFDWLDAIAYPVPQ